MKDTFKCSPSTLKQVLTLSNLSSYASFWQGILELWPISKWFAKTQYSSEGIKQSECLYPWIEKDLWTNVFYITGYGSPMHFGLKNTASGTKHKYIHWELNSELQKAQKNKTSVCSKQCSTQTQKGFPQTLQDGSQLEGFNIPPAKLVLNSCGKHQQEDAKESETPLSQGAYCFARSKISWVKTGGFKCELHLTTQYCNKPRTSTAQKPSFHLSAAQGPDGCLFLPSGSCNQTSHHLLPRAIRPHCVSTMGSLNKQLWDTADSPHPSASY